MKDMDMIIKIKGRNEECIWIGGGICDGIDDLGVDEAFGCWFCALICIAWIGMVGSCGGLGSWEGLRGILWSWREVG